jgi:hypothetical protein
VVGLDDVTAVSFECNRCRTRVSVSPDDIRLPHQYPQCNSVWTFNDPASFHSVTSPQMNFVSAVGQIRKQLVNGGPFKILLEFNEAEAG